MRECDGRVNPFQPVRGKRQRREERRARSERIDGRTEIVKIPGQREFERPRGAAERRLFFEDVDREAGAPEDDRGRQAVWTGADDAGSALSDGTDSLGPS